MTGTYTLNVTNAAGCWDIETTDVIVNAVPTAGLELTPKGTDIVDALSTILTFGAEFLAQFAAAFAWGAEQWVASN
jgi:hypothetical protein